MDANLLIHGESEHVHVHTKFHLLHPVDETQPGHNCFLLNNTDFKLFVNGSLLMLEYGAILDIDQFCIKSEAR
jgi:hypothetical protein